MLQSIKITRKRILKKKLFGFTDAKVEYRGPDAISLNPITNTK